MYYLCNMFEILKNNPKNCLAGKIFVTFINIVFWLMIFVCVLGVSLAGPQTPGKALVAAACIIGMVADMFFLHHVDDVVLGNPFRKVPVPVEPTAEESLEKAAKSGDQDPDMSIW